jgi:hypothetical protein
MQQLNFFTVLFITFSAALTSFSTSTESLTSLVANEASVSAEENEAPAVSAYAALYDGLELDKKGLGKEAFDYAIKGYEKLVQEGTVKNNRYLTIIDFSQSSRKKRFYLIDVETGKVVKNTFVSHGKNSGVDMAERFSNRINSEQSSLGFYVTTVTYNGKHGLSLRLSGKEKGFNDNAEARGIVMHGANYVNPGRVNSAYMGRSQGCPALAENEYAEVIKLIKDGSVMFIYHPSADYIKNSPIINS